MAAGASSNGGERREGPWAGRGAKGRVWLALAVSLLLLAVAAGPASAAPNHLTYFMHLGDIWSWDGADGGSAALEWPALGSSIGSPSVATEDDSFAYVVSSLDEPDKVVFVALNPAADSNWHEFPQASSPEVSPDGTMVLFDSWGSSNYSLRVFDSTTDSIIIDLPGAFAGSWSPNGRWLAYCRKPWDHPLNDGFYLYDTRTRAESKVSVPYPGESAADSNVWAPRWSPDSQWIALTKYVNSTGEIHIVTVHPNGGGVAQVVDVTPYDIFDYRWTSQPGDGQSLFIETVPALGSRSTIWEASPSPTGTQLMSRLRQSSFGFGASVTPDSPFTDVGASNYYQAIVMLRLAGIVGGYDDGTFRPGNPVWRAQFAKMISGALELRVMEGAATPFTDLGPNEWGALYPHEYVAAAYENDITKGLTATTFGPWADITRAQLVTMVVRAAQRWVDGGLPVPPADFVGMAPSSDPTHGANLHLAEYAGLLDGIDLNGWDVWASATRGEVAQMLLNMLRLIGPDSRTIGRL